jgi:hypothetical protein
MTLFEPHNFPFAVALGLMFAVVLIQLTGLGDMLGDADADAGLDIDGANSAGFLEGALSLLGIGRVPFLIWLMMFLLVFAAIGVMGQQLLIGLTGSPLATWIAALGAGAAALPVNGALARPMGYLMPKDETTAVSVDTLVRRDAEIQTGSARRGSPARAKVIDQHGLAHFVMVEPHDDAAVLSEGETVMLVRREGETFYAAQYENSHLRLK